MPPQGLLVIAAIVPKNWEVRFIDENMARAADADFVWGGRSIRQRHAHSAPSNRRHLPARPRQRQGGRAGGPSVSACPEYYSSFDYLHVGELGDATDELIAILAQQRRDPNVRLS